jgi:beta-lactamase regulating signal transducer with metallopeptidase domain
VLDVLSSFLLRATIVLGIAFVLHFFLRDRVPASARYRLVLSSFFSLPFLSALPLISGLVDHAALPTKINAQALRIGESFVFEGANRLTGRGDAFLVPKSLASLLITIWACGTFFVLVRSLAIRLTSFRNFRRLPLSDDPEWNSALAQALARLRYGAAPLLRMGDIPAPLVSGVFNTSIVVPVTDARWTFDRRLAAMMHEVGHIKRRDVTLMALAEVLSAPVWCVPFAPLLLKRMAEDREEACDELAISAGAIPSEYASLLMELAPKAHPHVFAAAQSMTGTTGIERRIRLIISEGPMKIGKGRAWSKAWPVVLAAAIIIASGFSTGLVAEAGPASELVIRTIAVDGEIRSAPIKESVLPRGKPLDGAWEITQDFGYSIDPFTNSRYRHTGIDLTNGRSGDRVRATMSGLVTEAGQRSDYGCYVAMSDGVAETLFLHLDAVRVAVGDRVRIGDAIGSVGGTGRATGPHLHYEIRIRGLAVDPSPILARHSAKGLH